VPNLKEILAVKTVRIFWFITFLEPAYSPYKGSMPNGINDQYQNLWGSVKISSFSIDPDYNP